MAEHSIERVETAVVCPYDGPNQQDNHHEKRPIRTERERPRQYQPQAADREQRKCRRPSWFRLFGRCGHSSDLSDPKCWGLIGELHLE